MGIERVDDAGVYKLSNDLALIQTIDFFTPIVDDPYAFGQIAAANALSDVYAMVGRPLTAMNVVCFPSKTMDIEILQQILKGGLDKMKEAEVALVGGHSVEDLELKYGLSVTGLIHPQRVLTNVGAKVGDKLILTKLLGTGIINTAIKGGLITEESLSKVIKSMVTLNRTASEAMQAIGVNASTDISGFGFLGHACEMIQNGDIGIVIHATSIPFFPEAEEFAKMGIIPQGAYRNKEFRLKSIKVAKTVSPYLLDILFDPQTSGGLLISVSPQKAEELLNSLKEKGVEEATIVGEVIAEPKGNILVR